MASDDENVFTCYLCGFSSCYDYFGKEPPWLKQIQFSEDLYIRKDPFAEPGRRKVLNFIALGGVCASCGKSVCADSESCSIFYVKRFCRQCAISEDSLPVEVKKDVEKLEAESANH